MIAAGAQREVIVGRDSWGRTVRTILGADDAASRLIVGETIHNGTGTWSSFPPHRHDRESAEEAQLEEVYFYRANPPTVSECRSATTPTPTRRSCASCTTATLRRSRPDSIRSWPHRATRLYYLWILAGEQRVMRVYVDPRYRWVSEQSRP